MRCCLCQSRPSADGDAVRAVRVQRVVVAQRGQRSGGTTNTWARAATSGTDTQEEEEEEEELEEEEEDDESESESESGLRYSLDTNERPTMGRPTPSSTIALNTIHPRSSSVNWRSMGCTRGNRAFAQWWGTQKKRMRGGVQICSTRPKNKGTGASSSVSYRGGRK